MRTYLSGKSHRLKAEQLLGSGGEADVYDLGDGRALKLFKRSDHPDFSQSREQQIAADNRLQEHQRKLPDFPAGLPEKVIAPQELAFDKRGGAIAGYAMPLVRDTEPLMRLGEQPFRDQGLTNKQVTQVFESLHLTLSGLHRRGIVVGDFNDLNVLVRDGDAWLIDADSMQFGSYRCAMFTERFVDPLHCDRAGVRPVQTTPHDSDSDWYAYHVMLIRSLLLVDPYGGVYRPKSSARKIPHSARPLHGITIFNPEVKLPRASRPSESLPENLLDHFRSVFEQDRRGPFPIDLLRGIRWKTCSACGMEFARESCPACGMHVPVQAPQPVGAPTSLTASELYCGNGLVLAATIDASGHLRALVWSEQEFRREDGIVVLRGDVDPKMKFRLLGDRTLIGRDNQLLVFRGDGELDSRQQIDSAAGVPAVDVNRQNVFWIDRGQLFRDGNLGSEYIGDVLAGQTRFWVGETFGYGFYRAGLLTRAFVFDARHGGINDTVPAPPISGQVLEATCQLSEELAWICCKYQDRGRIMWSLQVIDRLGKLVAAETYNDISEAPWIESIRGAAAGGKRLLVPTDAGIAVLDSAAIAGPSALKLISVSADHVDGGSRLLKSGDSICSVNRSKVVELSS